MDNRDESILDACLEELLGGPAPPDLTARILTRLEESESDILDGLLDETLGGITPPDVADQVLQVQQPVPRPPVIARGVERAMRRTPRQPNYGSWTTVALTVVLLAFGGMIGWRVWTIANPRDEAPVIAHEEEVFGPVSSPPRPTPPEQVVEAPIEQWETTTPVERGRERQPTRDRIVERPRQPAAPRPNDVVAAPTRPAVEDPSPLPGPRIVQSINELIRQNWEDQQVTPTVALDDAQWCRRAYVKLVGREPIEETVANFTASTAPDKREQLVDQLMRDDSYVEYFARHWGDVWTDVLLATSDRRVNRDGLAQFMRRSFATGKPFDQITTELITATGNGSQRFRDSNGAVNYLLAYASRDGKHSLASSHVSRTFMGVAMECNQCHNSATWRGYVQQEFWEFNAFFRQMRVESGEKLVNIDFPGDGTTPDDAEIYFELRSGLLKAAYPVFVDEEVAGFDRVPRSGLLKDVDRREALAEFIVQSRFFRQAMVNRFWGELFGVGFTTPVDELGPHNPASHPELLAKLGDQFAAHDYDVRKLIEWIVLSKPFGLAPQAAPVERGIGTQELFASFPVRPTKEQPLVAALTAATELYAAHSKPTNDLGTTARLTPTAPDSQPAEISEMDLATATSAQVIASSDASLFGQVILGSELSTEQKIDHMFFAVVHRRPNQRESSQIQKMLDGAGEQAASTVLQYVWWAISNSREAQ
jgi:hypothetical protein